MAGPVKTDAGYYVFRVTKVTKATQQGLDEEALDESDGGAE